MRYSLLLAAAIAVQFSSIAETVKDRKGAVLEDRAKMEGDERWIYNDWRLGLEQAKQTGKPLMVVLRCVPCLACMGIDASVLSDPDLRPFLDQFVRVRLINANALDLRLFQFDYDLSFSALFFNGDGTVYGRFGSWSHQKNSADKTTDSFKRALERALALHRDYPANKPALAGKQGREMIVDDPLKLPGLAGKYKRQLDWEGNVVQSCVHCHQIGDAVRSVYRDGGKPIPRQWVYPMPMAETIGLKLAPDHVARVEVVEPDSIAKRAGLRAGDELIEAAGQPLISIADLSWVLHHAADSGPIEVRYLRQGAERSSRLELVPDWRLKSDISRRVGTWPMRAMALGGLQLVSLSDLERTAAGIPPDRFALLVQHAGEYGNHAAAKNAGFRKGDILTQVGAHTRAMSESELIGRLLEEYQPGAKVDTRVKRGGESLQLKLPIQ